MRLARRALLACLVVAALALGHAARAADLDGVWVVDKVAWEKEADKVFARVLAGIPPQALQQMRAAGMDPTAAMRDSMAKGMDGEVRFLPDGRVRATTADRVDEASRWSLAGDVLTVQVPANEMIEAMRGPVRGNRIDLRPILKQARPETAFLGDLVFPLMRR
jgi:hypothetical protein